MTPFAPRPAFTPPRSSKPFEKMISSSPMPFTAARSEEHTSELRHQIISYAVFCLKKKKIERYSAGISTHWKTPPFQVVQTKRALWNIYCPLKHDPAASQRRQRHIILIGTSFSNRF